MINEKITITNQNYISPRNPNSTKNSFKPRIINFSKYNENMIEESKYQIKITNNNYKGKIEDHNREIKNYDIKKPFESLPKTKEVKNLNFECENTKLRSSNIIINNICNKESENEKSNQNINYHEYIDNSRINNTKDIPKLNHFKSSSNVINYDKNIEIGKGKALETSKQITRLLNNKNNNNQNEIKQKKILKSSIVLINKNDNDNNKLYKSVEFIEKSNQDLDQTQKDKTINNQNQNQNQLSIQNSEGSNLLLNLLNINDMILENEISDFLFGKIYLAYNEREDKQIYSLLKVLLSNQLVVERLFNQIELSKKISNSCSIINNLIGCCINKPDRSSYSFNILFDYFDYTFNSHINFLINNMDTYKEKEILNIMKSVLTALSFLNDNKSCHGNLSPLSIIFKGSNLSNSSLNILECKLLFPLITDPLTNPLLTSNQNKILIEMLKANELFLSPVLSSCLTKNQFYKIKHDPIKSDLYSLGSILLYACCLSLRPVMIARTKVDVDSVVKVMKTFMRRKYSDSLVNLICKLMCLCERERPSIGYFIKETDILIEKADNIN